MTAKTTVKMCDMELSISMKVFEMLNRGKVKAEMNHGHLGRVIVTDVEPKDLIYPEGWYYAKGAFRNKHTSSTGFYSEAIVIKSNEDFWEDYAMYCTLDD